MRRLLVAVAATTAVLGALLAGVSAAGAPGEPTVLSQTLVAGGGIVRS